VFELPEVRLRVIEHHLVALRCGCCGRVTEPAAPDEASGRAQYGPGVKAAVVYARGAQFLPYGRAATLLRDLLGVSPCRLWRAARSGLKIGAGRPLTSFALGPDEVVG
jgi:transposase